jgi:hypothetical protein
MREQKLRFALLARLPDMRDQLKKLQRQMDALLAEKNDKPRKRDQAA